LYFYFNFIVQYVYDIAPMCKTQFLSFSTWYESILDFVIEPRLLL